MILPAEVEQWDLLIVVVLFVPQYHSFSGSWRC
jgi:hypothetical protein